jgi:hypothetical protein
VIRTVFVLHSLLHISAGHLPRRASFRPLFGHHAFYRWPLYVSAPLKRSTVLFTGNHQSELSGDAGFTLHTYAPVPMKVLDGYFG